MSFNWSYPLVKWTTLNERNHRLLTQSRGGDYAFKLQIPYILYHKYIRYLHLTNTVKFIIIYTTMRAKHIVFIAIIVKVSLLNYVVYFSADAVLIS